VSQIRESRVRTAQRTIPCPHGAKNDEFYKKGWVSCTLTTQQQQWDWVVSFFALVSSYLVSPPQGPLPAHSLPCGRYVLVSACLHEFSCQIPSLTFQVVYLRCRCHHTRVFIIDFTNTFKYSSTGLSRKRCCWIHFCLFTDCCHGGRLAYSTMASNAKNRGEILYLQ